MVSFDHPKRKPRGEVLRAKKQNALNHRGTETQRKKYERIQERKIFHWQIDVGEKKRCQKS
jgi:hypothetical protein